MFLRQTGVRVLRPVLHSSQEGWGVASNFGSAALESFSQEIQVQDAHYSYHRESDRIRGLVCHDRSEGRNFHVSIIPSHRKRLRFAFGGAKRSNIGFFRLARTKLGHAITVKQFQ